MYIGADVNDDTLHEIPFDSDAEGGSGAGNSFSFSVSTDHDNDSIHNGNHNLSSDLSTNCHNSDKDTKMIEKKIFNSIIITSNVFTTIYSKMKDTDEVKHENEKLNFGCKNDICVNNDVDFYDSDNDESNNSNDIDTMNTHNHDNNCNSNETNRNNTNDRYNHDSKTHSNTSKDNHVLNAYTCAKMILLSDKRFFHEWIQKSKLT
jgi:hypothetical protein